MPNTARWAATMTLTATAVCGPLTGNALAATPSPNSLYAPSSLVLTMGHGELAADVAPERAVTLSCAPTASGTHPAAASACAELGATGGNFGALLGRSVANCTREYDPVVVTVDGVWQGKRVSFENTFANECVKNSYGVTVFTF
ncbi:subtilase-type protease inhibitor [Streptomyces sp. NBC_00878]|uniref:subtilase-type protease inhibitor n=1 Tax=Streptomyces sp. NBC_00878 TaxID=2975854 RepID=UPI00225BEE40|nr:subtilase-type protease inhibitor [Streptomyces sp. NBC_00878]MCX4903136.1 subtilase-type protease inhibitor [Streptomyces sp. NBC_00878]